MVTFSWLSVQTNSGYLSKCTDSGYQYLKIALKIFSILPWISEYFPNISAHLLKLICLSESNGQTKQIGTALHCTALHCTVLHYSTLCFQCGVCCLAVCPALHEQDSLILSYFRAGKVITSHAWLLSSYWAMLHSSYWRVLYSSH